jgi:hypothetical protein
MPHVALQHTRPLEHQLMPQLVAGSPAGLNSPASAGGSDSGSASSATPASAGPASTPASATPPAFAPASAPIASLLPSSAVMPSRSTPSGGGAGLASSTVTPGGSPLPGGVGSPPLQPTPPNSVTSRGSGPEIVLASAAPTTPSSTKASGCQRLRRAGLAGAQGPRASRGIELGAGIAPGTVQDACQAPAGAAPDTSGWSRAQCTRPDGLLITWHSAAAAPTCNRQHHPNPAAFQRAHQAAVVLASYPPDAIRVSRLISNERHATGAIPPAAVRGTARRGLAQ